MTRLSVALIVLGISVFQLAWLFMTWRSQGFGAAFKLFVYGVLSAIAAFLQGLLDVE